jgi:hypothetical protein
MSTSRMKGYALVGTLNSPKTDRLLSAEWNASMSA